MLTRKEIKAARKKLGDTQTAFAARLGVDQGTISRWENEGPPSRVLTQRALMRALAELRSEAAE